jgi:hypothetical protein
VAGARFGVPPARLLAAETFARLGRFPRSSEAALLQAPGHRAVRQLWFVSHRWARPGLGLPDLPGHPGVR